MSSAATSEHKNTEAGRAAERCHAAGVRERQRERELGYEANALAPDNLTPAGRDAWLTGYLSEVKARG